MTPFPLERGCVGEMRMPGSVETSVRIHRRSVTSARPRNVPEDDETLREDAVRAIEEGRADHAAGRTFTLTEIKKDLRIVPADRGVSPGDGGSLDTRLRGRTSCPAGGTQC